MTIDQVRDRIHALCPKTNPDDLYTLDGIAALIKQAGYKWFRGMHYGSWMWHAAKPRQPIMDGPRVPDTNSDIEDFTRLLLAVLESQAKEPA